MELPVLGFLSPALRSALAEAARFEADRRAASYPRAVRDGKLGDDEAHLDWQAWLAIAGWLRDGRSELIGNPGGAAPRDGEGDREAGAQAIIDWPLLEEAAARAHDRLESKARAIDVASDTGKAEFERLRLRADRIFAIRHYVARQRLWLEETNRQIRAREVA